MKLDHPGVASGLELDPTSDRLRTLLGEEILPRLERPGRYVGPFAPRRIARGPAKPARSLLLWPSVPDTHAAPASLNPLWEGLRRRGDVGLVCLPTEDLQPHLAAHALPLFCRPQWTPAVGASLWLVWLDRPSQALGLLTLLDAAPLPRRAADRGPDHPVVVLAGPGCLGGCEALGVFADAILPLADAEEILALVGDLLDASPEMVRTRIADEERFLPGRTAAPMPTASGEPFDLSSPDDRESDWVWATVSDLDLRRTPSRWRNRAGNWVTDVPVWSPSQRLREELQLDDWAQVVGDIRAALGADQGSETRLLLAVGLPGERDTDRAAIADFVEEILRVAPRGPKPLAVRLFPYAPTREELGREAPNGSLSQRREWLTQLVSRVRASKVGMEVGDPVAAWISSILATCGPEAAAGLEWIHARGARDDESALARQPDLWHKALQVNEILGDSDSPDRAHGSRPLLRVLTGGSDSTGAPKDASAEKTVGLDLGTPLESPVETMRAPSSRRARANRWLRWQALAPRQFEYRLEFAKEGLVRFVGHREVGAMLIDAICEAGLPLAKSGVVQPRPKITFGPPLPVGVEGLREYVDVSLLHKVPDIKSLLNDRLPAGLHIRHAAFIPGASSKVSLGQLARAEYDAAVRVADLESAAATVESRMKALRVGPPTLVERADSSLDLSEQVVHATVQPTEAGELKIAFTLDLTHSGVKAKPIEVLSYLLHELTEDTRIIPIRRLRLLARRVDSSQLMTPLEQVELAERTLRARMKLCA